MLNYNTNKRTSKQLLFLINCNSTLKLYNLKINSVNVYTSYSIFHNCFDPIHALYNFFSTLFECYWRQSSYNSRARMTHRFSIRLNVGKLTNLKRQCRAFKIIVLFFCSMECRIVLLEFQVGESNFFLHEEAKRWIEISITNIIKPCAADDYRCVCRWPKSCTNHYIPTLWTRCENMLKFVCLGRGEDDLNHK